MPPKQSDEESGIYGLPEDVEAIRVEIANFFDKLDEKNGR